MKLIGRSVLVTACVLAWWSAPAAAVTPPLPGIDVDPQAAPPGAAVDVTGSDWADTCGVNLWWDDIGGELIGFAAVDPDTDTFQTDVDVPTDAAPGPHLVVAEGLDFAVEFCGEPTGDTASADFRVLAPPTPTPTVHLSALEGTPGGEITVIGDGFCAAPCSPVSIWFGGALAAQEITVGPDGTFVVDVVLPVVSPLGLTQLFAVQTDAAGAERFGYGEFETTVRPRKRWTRPTRSSSASRST